MLGCLDLLALDFPTISTPSAVNLPSGHLEPPVEMPGVHSFQPSMIPQDLQRRLG